MELEKERVWEKRKKDRDRELNEEKVIGKERKRERSTWRKKKKER